MSKIVGFVLAMFGAIIIAFGVLVIAVFANINNSVLGTKVYELLQESYDIEEVGSYVVLVGLFAMFFGMILFVIGVVMIVRRKTKISVTSRQLPYYDSHGYDEYKQTRYEKQHK